MVHKFPSTTSLTEIYKKICSGAKQSKIVRRRYLKSYQKKILIINKEENIKVNKNYNEDPSDFPVPWHNGNVESGETFKHEKFGIRIKINRRNGSTQQTGIHQYLWEYDKS